MSVERVHTISQYYYHDSVYDVSSRESFQGLEVWLNELDSYATKKDLIKMLVANKIDKVKRTGMSVSLCSYIWVKRLKVKG